jgi:hypothetical protein
VPYKGVDPRGGPLTWLEELLDPAHYTLRDEARKLKESEDRERVSRESLRRTLGFGPTEEKIAPSAGERTRANERDTDIANTRRLIELAFQHRQPGLARQLAEEGTASITKKYNRRALSLIQFYRDRALLYRRSGEETNAE